MIIFLKKYKSKIALMVFICVLVCTVSCLLDFKTIEKQKMPGLEKKSVFMAAESAVGSDGCLADPALRYDYGAEPVRHRGCYLHDL